MAQGGKDGDLVEIFQKFCSVGKEDKDKIKSKAAKKIVEDCWQEHYKNMKPRSVADMVDSSVFSQMKKGNFIPVTKENVNLFIQKTAHEIVKVQKDSKIKADAKEVLEEADKLKGYIKAAGGPKIKHTAQSKSGAVDHLTDTSQYTGTHGERFNKDGTGKGIDGRENRADKSGYVQGYKDKDTFDKKK